MSTDRQKTTAKAIPSTRTVIVNDAEHMPHDYSTTPGGTLFSTTPGGTRIIYDRRFLLECRRSPVAKTPPQGLPKIPGVTSPSSKDRSLKAHNGEQLNNNNITEPDTEDCQKTTAKAIPSTRTVIVNDAEHMPHDYSTTPGGTLFSTTPGGTRIIYDRRFLLECRRSPVAKTPPQGLPKILGVTSPSSKDRSLKAHNGEQLNNNNITEPDTGEDSQFEMDI